MSAFEVIVVVGMAVIVLLQIIILTKRDNLPERLKELKLDNRESVYRLGEILSSGQQNMSEGVSQKIELMSKGILDIQAEFRKSLDSSAIRQEERFKTFSAETEQKLENIRGALEIRLRSIQEDNGRKLDDMRQVVDEKLQESIDKKMTESFKLVSDRLEQVYRGLGEMQSLAVGVGDLKKVLTNVKSRGILGEIQLGAILEDILSSEQYEVNCKVVSSRDGRVEYAVKLPGQGDSFAYLPIDAKFPGDTYRTLTEAYEVGDKATIEIAAKNLCARIKAEAKDISEKYIYPPETTDFAVMFLPFEGLYAEVVNRGLLEELQKTYHVTIAGPSTMAAMLCSIRMCFRSVALRRCGDEVWKVLSAVKTEFESFEGVLINTQKKLENASNELDKLVGTRTRAIRRKLKDVTNLTPELDMKSSQLLLNIDESE
jgi:DNA recombination protein RmuC